MSSIHSHQGNLFCRSQLSDRKGETCDIPPWVIHGSDKRIWVKSVDNALTCLLFSTPHTQALLWEIEDISYALINRPIDPLLPTVPIPLPYFLEISFYILELHCMFIKSELLAIPKTCTIWLLNSFLTSLLTTPLVSSPGITCICLHVLCFIMLSVNIVWITSQLHARHVGGNFHASAHAVPSEWNVPPKICPLENTYI